MGYTILIGEASITPAPDELGQALQWETSPSVEITVHEIEQDGAAPDGFGNPSNKRMPSYMAWGDFCDDAGLTNLFFNEESGLFRQHPGACLLTQNHLAEMLAARQRPLEDYHVERLEWLIWWTAWALENCRVPTIYNR